jgi:hypothetical protein
VEAGEIPDLFPPRCTERQLMKTPAEACVSTLMGSSGVRMLLIALPRHANSQCATTLPEAVVHSSLCRNWRLACRTYQRMLLSVRRLTQ